MLYPYRRVAESLIKMRSLTANKMKEEVLLEMYNSAYSELVINYEWITRYTSAIVNTVNPNTTGTVTMTLGSASVVGVGTSFTSGMIGRFLRSNDEDSYYKIVAVGDPEHLVLEKEWPYTTVVGASFEIFALDYELPDDCERLWPYLTRTQYTQGKPAGWIDIADPSRRITGDWPLVWASKGIVQSGTSQGRLKVELWPRLATAVSLRVPYMIRVGIMTPADTPIIRSDLIEYKALTLCYTRLYAEFGAEHWANLLGKYEGYLNDALGDALRDDQAKHALPDAVQPERSTALSYEFAIRNDVEGMET